MDKSNRENTVAVDEAFLEQVLEQYKFEQDPDDQRYRDTGKCSGCVQYVPINGKLHHEFGVCFNENSFFHQLRHKFDGCDQFEKELRPK